MKNLMLLLLFLMTVVLSSCETTKGVGKDVENTGENIQEGVEDGAR